ncbi:MAG: deoxyguanosinetriphosphate triphosphohydrolase, partial [Clostridia bacterium]|nr:deoxyguanosinetriphosphate triphosphohydrolase [Clostridia bacterium]
HDIDDAISAGIISENDLPREAVAFLGTDKSERIDTLVSAVVSASEGTDIKMDAETQKYFDIMHGYLFDSVYTSPSAKSEESKVSGIIEGIYNHILSKPEVLSGEYKKISEREGVSRAAADYIAGMTDHFAVTTFENIYIPKFWRI